MPSSVSVAAASRRKQGNPYPSATYIHQRIAVAIQWGNAAAVLGTSPPRDTDPIFIKINILIIAWEHTQTL